MIVFLIGASGIGKTTLVQALGERLGCPHLEMSWMPEFRVMNDRPISFEDEELIAVDTLLLVARNLLKHGHRFVLLSDFSAEAIPTVLSSTTPAERLLIKLVMDDDTELRRRVLDPSHGYRDWEGALLVNRQLLAAPIAEDEIVVDVTGMSITDELDLLASCICNRAHSSKLTAES